MYSTVRYRTLYYSIVRSNNAFCVASFPPKIDKGTGMKKKEKETNREEVRIEYSTCEGESI